MNSPALTRIRQISANLSDSWPVPFACAELRANVGSKAFRLEKRGALYCQNRYPSPSEWLGSSPRTRPLTPPISRRPAAYLRALFHNSLVVRHVCDVSVGRGQLAQQNGGRNTCTRKSHSSSPQHCLDWLAAIPAAILSAPSSAAQSDVPQVKSTKTVNAFPARPSVPQRAHWQTTSKSDNRDAAGFRGGIASLSRRLTSASATAAQSRPSFRTIHQTRCHAAALTGLGFAHLTSPFDVPNLVPVPACDHRTFPPIRLGEIQ